MTKRLHILTKLKHNKIYDKKEVEQSASFFEYKKRNEKERGKYEEKIQLIPGTFSGTVIYLKWMQQKKGDSTRAGADCRPAGQCFR